MRLIKCPIWELMQNLNIMNFNFAKPKPTIWDWPEEQKYKKYKINSSWESCRSINHFVRVYQLVAL